MREAALLEKEEQIIFKKIDALTFVSKTKITFDTDKMTVELSLIEGGVVHTVKLIFIKVSSWLFFSH